MARRAAQCWNADFLHLSAAEKLSQCEMAAIIVPLDNLRTFPWIKSRIDSGKRKLHGWYFDSMSGAMLNYNEDTLAYKALA